MNEWRDGRKDGWVVEWEDELCNRKFPIRLMMKPTFYTTYKHLSTPILSGLKGHSKVM